MRALITTALLACTSILFAQTGTEKAIKSQLGQMMLGIENKSFATFSSVFTEDVVIYGTAPGEAPFETEAAMQNMKGLFETPDFTYTYELKHRDIIVNPGNKTALVVEQGYHNLLGKNQQARVVYHFIHQGDEWLVNFYSIAMIPENADLSRIDKLLEK